MRLSKVLPLAYLTAVLSLVASGARAQMARIGAVAAEFLVFHYEAPSSVFTLELYDDLVVVGYFCIIEFFWVLQQLSLIHSNWRFD